MTCRAWFFALLVVGASAAPILADKVITKDGKVYSGKILIDGDKAVLIGNPPFDPESTLIKTEDIERIVYDEYKPNDPAVRKRGLAAAVRLTGNAYSSSELSLGPATGIELEGSFRFHPAIELGAGIHWIPQVNTSDGDFGIATSTSPGAPSRSYHSFGQYTLGLSGKLYPFHKKKWKTEPYALVGYGWSHLNPKGSGDSLISGGWLLGAGALHPLSKHLFLEGRFGYQKNGYDEIDFLGQEGHLSPEISQSQYILSLGISYRI